MTTYTAAQTEPLAQRLVADLPGLDIRLARAWITTESGVGNNPLGVTHVENGVSKLNTYATPQQGIDAAANLVKTSSHYSGIRTAIAGGNIRQQAIAVMASPWNGGHYASATLLWQLTGLERNAGNLRQIIGGEGGSPQATATTPPGAAPGPKAAAPYTPGPGAGINLPNIDIPGAIIQATTYVLAVAVIGFGIFLYSKGGGQQVIAVPA